MAHNICEREIDREQTSDVTLQTKRQVRTHTVSHEGTNTKEIFSMNLLRVL